MDTSVYCDLLEIFHWRGILEGGTGPVPCCYPKQESSACDGECTH